MNTKGFFKTLHSRTLKTNVIVVAVLLGATLLFGSCSSYKKIKYFQNIDSVTLQQLPNNYEAIIKKDDVLSIVVTGPDKTVVSPYNLTLSESGSGASNPESTTLTYLVDSKGDIDFPVLGKIHVEGMTRTKLVDYLTKEIGKDIKNPIVHISFKNYKVTVLGEVKSPGTFTYDSEKLNILQALGRAGDLNLTAQREDILLIREENGMQTYHKIDLKDSHLLDSPYFYLQQNDVIIVPPSPTRVATATTATSIWGVLLSSITTIVALLAFLKK